MTENCTISMHVYQSYCLIHFSTGEKCFLSTGKCKYKYLPILEINLCHVFPTKWISDYSFSPTISIAAYPRELNEHMLGCTFHFVSHNSWKKRLRESIAKILKRGSRQVRRKGTSLKSRWAATEEYSPKTLKMDGWMNEWMEHQFCQTSKWNFY